MQRRMRLPDATRFPARIKAAATALLNCGYEGRFDISHSDGLLTIRAVWKALAPPMNANASTVYLISCVSQKRTHPCPARELYVSEWFLKARRYTEASDCYWFILSAEHGLVPPDRVIAPYERTLNTMPIKQRRVWANHVLEQLINAAPRLAKAVFLAGERYREFLARFLADRGVAVDVPMAGLRIGEQLRWLAQHTPPTM